MRGGIQAAFVDVDGTCVFCEERNQRAIEAAASDGGFEIMPEFWRRYIGAGDKVIFHRIVEALDNDSARLNRFLDVHQTEEDFELACLDYYYQMRDEIAANPSVYDVVLNLLQQDVAVIPVSNAMRTAVHDNLEVSGYPVEAFPFILSKDDVELVGLNMKPAPDPYSYALELYNRDRAGGGKAPFKPENCLVIEDSQTGAKAGLAAGMNTVHIVAEASHALDPVQCQGRGDSYKPCYAHDLARVIHSIDQKLMTRRPDYRPDMG